MESRDRELLINRICSGYLSLNGYLYKHPSPKQLYKADLVYQKSLKNEWDKNDAHNLLCELGKWDNKIDEEISIHIPKLMERFKIEIYQNFSSKDIVAKSRENLKKVEERLLSLIQIKHSFDEYTAEGLAEKEKTLYLIEKCTEDLNCEPVSLLPYYNSSILHEHIYREIARSSEWASKWTAFKRGVKIFSKNLTHEQEKLIRWSSLYENIFEQEDCPSDQIIDDDDALDGWLLWKKRENLRLKGLGEIDSQIKNKEAQEVYIPVNKVRPVFESTPEYIEKSKEVNSYNSPEALRIKKERFEKVQKEGVVAEYTIENGKLKGGFADSELRVLLARNNIKT